MHVISSYRGNRPTNTPTNTPKDKTDYNTALQLSAHFIHLPTSPASMDCQQIWHVGSSRGPNQLCLVCWQSIQGFIFCRGSKLDPSHWPELPLTQCCAAEQCLWLTDRRMGTPGDSTHDILLYTRGFINTTTGFHRTNNDMIIAWNDGSKLTHHDRSFSPSLARPVGWYLAIEPQVN